MKKVTPLLLLIASLVILSGCTRNPQTSTNTYTENGTPIYVETETITSPPQPTSTPVPLATPKTSSAAPQSDQDLLMELNSQSDISVDSDLQQIETQFR